jgi:hypothetical protein
VEVDVRSVAMEGLVSIESMSIESMSKVEVEGATVMKLIGLELES